MNDKRIWNPDETCQPFLLENSSNNINFPIFRFRVPNGQTSVIASISLGSVQFAPITKDNTRIIIKRQQLNNTAMSNDLDCIPIHGALDSVEEITPLTFINTPGLIISGGTTTPRPCRIILMSGTIYEVIVSGSGATLVECSLFGWTFPNKPSGA